MTRAKDISKILTDADISGTLDVSGAFTSQGIDDNADAVAITIDSSERVGINNSSPTTDLDVTGNILTSSALYLNSLSVGSMAYFSYGGGNPKLWNTVNGALLFGTNNTERMRINSSGRVGIGTSSPTEQLSVANSSGRASIFLASGGTNQGYISYFNSTQTLSLGNASPTGTGVNGGQQLNILNSGNVGIGSLAPTASSGGKILAIETSADEHTNLVFNTANTAKNGIIEARRTGRSGVERFAQINLENDSDNGLLRFFTSTSGSDISEACRIDPVGRFLLGTTTASGLKMDIDTNSGNGIFIQRIGSGLNGVLTRASNSHTYNAMRFDNVSASIVGTISCSTTGTTYNTSSDYRLKENVSYDFDATTRLKQLKPCRFNFIADETNTLVDGFLAHEAQAVVAECVTGTHNEVDADGKAVMQGIDQSKMIPLLVKTIQELEARITALEGA